MSGIFFIRSTSKLANFKTEIYLILITFMLFGRFSLYIISPRTFKTLKGSSLVKSNLLLNIVV